MSLKACSPVSLLRIDKPRWGTLYWRAFERLTSLWAAGDIGALLVRRWMRTKSEKSGVKRTFVSLGVEKWSQSTWPPFWFCKEENVKRKLTLGMLSAEPNLFLQYFTWICEMTKITNVQDDKDNQKYQELSRKTRSLIAKAVLYLLKGANLFDCCLVSVWLVFNCLKLI